MNVIFHSLFLDGSGCLLYTSLVYLVDFKNPANNDFTVANQWTFIENSEKRPDVILFINGLPLVVVELKSQSRGNRPPSATLG